MSEDNLSATLITKDLGTRVVGKSVIYYPQLASTMDVARGEVKGGAAQGTVVIAGEQVAGRGRIKRVWLSPRGNIALSVILYPDVSSLPYLVMLASLAVVHAIETVTGLKPQIKWPNDVLIKGKKVCGILIESEVRGESALYAIIGIGINISLKYSDIPAIAVPATSLAGELGREVSRVDLIRNLLVEVDSLYGALPAGEAIYEEWRDRLVTLGKRVNVSSSNKVLEGTAESVTGDGRLLLRHSDGSSAVVIAGDVTLRDSE